MAAYPGPEGKYGSDFCAYEITPIPFFSHVFDMP